MMKSVMVVAVVVAVVVVMAVVFLFPLEASAEESTQPSEASRNFRIDHLFRYEQDFINDKLKMTYSDGTWTLKTDLNTGSQSEYSIDFNAVDSGRNLLTLSLMGNFKKKIQEETFRQTFDFVIFFKRQLGELPLLGNTSLRLYHFGSLQRGEGMEQKFRLGIFAKNLDVAVQLMHDRDGKNHTHYFFSYHNRRFNLTLGKAVDRKITGIAILKEAPLWHVSLWDYYDDGSRKLTALSYSAMKNGDPDFYHQVQADLGAWLVILGDKGINMPLFPSFLVFGDFSHYLSINSTPAELKVANQLGVRIKNRLGIGMGALLKRYAGQSVRFSPIFSAFIKIPIRNQTFFIEGKYEDKALSFYAYLQFKF